MNGRLVARGETALIHAQNDCLRAVRELVPAGDAAHVLERLVFAPIGHGFTLQEEARSRGLGASTTASTWHRAGAGGLLGFRRTILRYVLRRVVDVPGISLADAALVVGASTTSALHRAMRTDSGLPLGEWVAQTAGTAEALLEEWRELLRARAIALGRVRFCNPRADLARRDERRQLLERRLARLREAAVRTETQIAQLRVQLLRAS